MSDPPRRTPRDLAGQLAVILLLIALLVGAVIVLDKVVTSHSATPPPTTLTVSYNYSCCSGFSGVAAYHPGEIVKLDWYKQAITPGDFPKRTITLTAFLSKRFASVAAIKSSTKSGSFTLASGPFVAAAGKIQVSNRSGASPVSSIRIPGDANKGYYALAFTSGQKGFSVSSIEMIRVI
jgi:hypothetical protein